MSSADILAFHGVNIVPDHVANLRRRYAAAVEADNAARWPNNPPLVAQPDGWTVNVFPMPGRPGQWKVIASKYGRVLHAERLTAQDVIAFDGDTRWNR